MGLDSLVFEIRRVNRAFRRRLRILKDSPQATFGVHRATRSAKPLFDFRPTTLHRVRHSLVSCLAGKCLAHLAGGTHPWAVGRVETRGAMPTRLNEPRPCSFNREASLRASCRMTLGTNTSRSPAPSATIDTVIPATYSFFRYLCVEFFLTCGPDVTYGFKVDTLFFAIGLHR